MEYLDLTNIEVLIPLLDLTINGKNIDFHNDYDCYNITYKEEKAELVIDFKLSQENKRQLPLAKLLFLGVKNYQTKYPLEEKEYSITVDNLGRGTISKTSKFYFEGFMRYYFIGFFEGQSIEVFCTHSLLILYQPNCP